MTAISCPVCDGAFKEVLRDGVLIDICTQCNGIWLDCGELERLITAHVRQQHASPIDKQGAQNGNRVPASAQHTGSLYDSCR